MTVRVVPLQECHLEAAVELQRLAFPPPFDEELLWKAEHLLRHVALFPNGQFAAETEDGTLMGTCSNTRITEENWIAHQNWDTTVGGPFLTTYDPNGSTLYGLDISVHPAFRRMGVGRALYQARFDLVSRETGLVRYGTACRIPGYAPHRSTFNPEAYIQEVVQGTFSDPTLTPLLKMGLTYLETIADYMEDEESGNAAAMLEWKP